MKTHHNLRLKSLFLLTFLFIVSGLSAQKDFSYVQLRPTSCKPGTFVFTANSYVSTSLAASGCLAMVVI